MMRRLAALLAVLMLLSLAALADKREGGGGIVYGEDHAYSILAPEGWIFDNESGVKQGIQAVIYPRGLTWENSSAVIYSGITRKAEGQSLEDVIEADLANFRKLNPDLEVEERPGLKTLDGREAEVRLFRGDRFGNTELVAYVDTPRVVCEVVLSARKKESFRLAVPAFVKVVGSFEFITEKVEQ